MFRRQRVLIVKVETQEKISVRWPVEFEGKFFLSTNQVHRLINASAQKCALEQKDFHSFIGDNFYNGVDAPKSRSTRSVSTTTTTTTGVLI